MFSTHTASLWRYHDEGDGDWHEVHLDDKENVSIERPETFSFATFNVMLDSRYGRDYKPNVAQSHLRYRKVLAILKDLDCDVVGLNEVTPNFVKLLCGEKWVRDGYFVSESPNGNFPTLPHDFGNVILTKWKPVALYSSKLETLKRPATTAVFSFATQSDNKEDNTPTPTTLLLSSAHLIALTSRAEQRRREIHALYAALDKLAATKFQGSRCEKLIMGDMNFHRPCEDSSIREDYDDVWAKLHPNDPGFTWDAHRNPMIQHLWPLGFDSRRMRLDRVLYSGSHLEASTIDIFGDCYVSDEKNATDGVQERKACVSPGFGVWKLPTRVVEQVFDLFSTNIIRNPEDYLFPSDHFGLVVRGSVSC